ncbi:Shedu anti-phage system protein SduA domain-containing protein [Saccharicrinis fermentans]|uniref:Shedu protein SduA C-terminal domain-containing protein n=1 Tax=Saccharicrinis fermentans DSM 9555 = JCM 21142 TaxID=869213 RepID=W7YAA9_9BACT|nr:Shedu anti-phage system protein SduA domain-containing protein [Saccharicrinis fermentans]GAF05272.1 hypothetical protein JCM21142_93999 [Saccharicrinis fermentans DSM 9555 = JCM 21142]
MKLPFEKTKVPKPKDEIKHPEDYPLKEFFTHRDFLKDGAKESFVKLIEEKSDEKLIDKFLSKNPEIFETLLDTSGHHGIWVIPKQQIKTRIGNERGLIPDFIVGGKSSDGFQWWVIELKGANEKLLKVNAQNEVYFTIEGNKGISQLTEYIDYCRKYQSHLRDAFKLKDFREPSGILVIGNENEFESDEIKQNFKSAWNRLTKPNLEIRTYNAIIRKL